MRWAMAALLLAGAAYLYLHQKRGDAQQPPQPATLNLPVAPVLTMAEIEKVRRSTNDQDPEVRWAAIQLLVTLKDPEIVAVMDNIVQRDPDPELRRRGVELLHRVENVSILPPIIRGLKDPEKEVRIACLRTVGNIGDPAAIPWVTEALKDYEPEVKVEALRTLTRFEDKRRQEFQALAEKLRRDYEQAVKRAQESPFDLKLPTPE